MTAELPRLAVVVDGNAERTAGSELLLYRTLGVLPADRLRVVFNADFSRGGPESFLPGVEYRPIQYRIPRWVRNRFNPAWPVVAARYMRRYADQVLRLIDDFAPEAVATVPIWYLWFAAAEAARLRGLPLHLIIHDDWNSYTTFRRTGPTAEALRWACRRVMRPLYRRASSRLCVSPGMIEHYEKCFGVGGSLLYPFRGADSPLVRTGIRPNPAAPPVLAYCGDIHLEGTADLLRRTAALLAPLGGHLDLYTRATPAQLVSTGLTGTVVRNCGFFPAGELGDRVGRTAHALFLPASFDPGEWIDVSTLFPSKLADYTAIGLPILIWGPGYSSAARWAADHPGATLCITDLDAASVQFAVQRLASDQSYAEEIAAEGMRAGSACFDPASARQILYDALLKAHRQTVGASSYFSP